MKSLRNPFLWLWVMSRFPFDFPCCDVSAETVNAYFFQLLSISGLPGFVYSDRGSAFMS